MLQIQGFYSSYKHNNFCLFINIRIRAFIRSVEPKSFISTIFKSITLKVKCQWSYRRLALILLEEFVEEQLFWTLYSKPTIVFYDQYQLFGALAFSNLKLDSFALSSIWEMHVLSQLS